MLKQGIRAFTAVALVLAAASASAGPPAGFEQRVEQLRKAFGVPGVTIAIVENGTRPDQRVTAGRLADLARLAATHASSRGDAGPSLIIVGEVAARAALAEEPLAEVS